MLSVDRNKKCKIGLYQFFLLYSMLNKSPWVQGQSETAVEWPYMQLISVWLGPGKNYRVQDMQHCYFEKCCNLPFV